MSSNKKRISISKQNDEKKRTNKEDATFNVLTNSSYKQHKTEVGLPPAIYNSIKCPEADKEQKKQLLAMLEKSLSLHIMEKLYVILSMPNLSCWQVDMLLETWVEEEQKWQKDLFEEFKENALEISNKNDFYHSLRIMIVNAKDEWKELSYQLKRKQMTKNKNPILNIKSKSKEPKFEMFDILYEYFCSVPRVSQKLFVCKACGHCMEADHKLFGRYNVYCPVCHSIFSHYNYRKNEIVQIKINLNSVLEEK